MEALSPSIDVFFRNVYFSWLCQLFLLLTGNLTLQPRHAKSLAVDRTVLVVARGIWLPDQALNPGPPPGRAESPRGDPRVFIWEVRGSERWGLIPQNSRPYRKPQEARSRSPSLSLSVSLSSLSVSLSSLSVSLSSLSVSLHLFVSLSSLSLYLCPSTPYRNHRKVKMKSLTGV